jgi:type IV secretion system protein VirB4
MSLFLIEDSLPKLEETLERTVHTLGRMGLVPIREDIRMEETFWAQLPGNFEFLKRRHPINTNWVGGFASLHNFPAGQAVGNWWGPAATVFYTSAGTPYFFSFHDKTGNGHTTIIGPFGSGKTVLLNFLISEARKFRSRLIVFDRDHASKIFINALGGTYHTINGIDSQLKLNPLLLEDSQENRDFLAVWLSALIGGGGAVHPDELSILRYAVELNYSIPPEHRNLSTIVYYLTHQGYTSTAQKLQRWTSFGEYGRVFDNTEENIGVDHIPILGFEMGLVARNITVLGPVLLYLLHRINLSLDGYPTMIVLDEAWSLLDNHVFAPFIGPWLENLKQKNTMAILATESVDEASESRISSTIMDHIATSLYLPNPFAGEAYQEVFRLSDEEYQMVTAMQPEKRQFLLRHGTQSVVAVLNLFGMDDLLSVLSGNEHNIQRMERLKALHGPEPEQWLPHFLEEIKQETTQNPWAMEVA